MAREFARAFYKSKQWKSTRDAYMKIGHGLCERCLSRGEYKPASIVHHKVHLSPDNINDPLITLGFGNLERVCRDCHAEVHPEIYANDGDDSCRVRFDADGNVIRREFKDVD